MLREKLGSSFLCDNSYGWRYFLWVPPDIRDYKKFPLREICNEKPAFQFKKDQNLENEFINTFRTIEYRTKRKRKTKEPEEFLESSKTTAFLVIKDDTILYEKYFNNGTRDTLNNCLSVSKSVVSALVGIAIDRGDIKSVDDPMVDYLPELKDKGVGSITLKHLLTMSSGLKHKLGFGPWHDNVRAYYSPNIREFALDVRVEEEPARHYNYNNCHAQLLGLILERVTGQPVSTLLQEQIWKPLGMEFPASWNLDNKKNGFELMIAGLNAAAIDFAKLGRLYLHKGNWNGKQVIPAHWVEESTRPTGKFDGDYFRKNFSKVIQTPEIMFFNDDTGYYGYFWFGYEHEGEGKKYDFFSYGVLGQFIYVVPSKNLIVVRMGKDMGDVFWWPEVLREIGRKI